MAVTHDLASRPWQESAKRQCRHIRDLLVKDGLYDSSPEADHAAGTERGTPVPTRWRISPTPFWLSREQEAFFQSLGDHLLAFYRALNRLYQESARGTQPAWVAAYLDQGKPESLITYSRMKRFRDLLPGVIRPDMIPVETSSSGSATDFVITELDSVPGGIGLTGSLARAYAALGAAGQPIGGADGMLMGFAAMLRDQLASPPTSQAGCIAIVVSEESKDYRPEMAWLAGRLREIGVEAYCVEPKEVRFTEGALLTVGEAGEVPIAVLYRFFELFDLKNIPKAELIMYSAKKGWTVVTPPFKPALEEKLAFALLHHPILAPFWQRELGEERFLLLTRLVPRTWILDPRPLPPTAIIPDLRIGGQAVGEWGALKQAGQKERRYVIKPSGFSELAWGSRGVSVGHDLSQAAWSAALDAALAAFPSTPYILQEFHKGRQFDLSYYEPHTDQVVPMSGRARLSPYYFVSGGHARLAGILATVCPLDKKLIHGMRDAIMVPCAIQQ